MRVLALTLPLPPAALSPNSRGRWERIKATESYRDMVIVLARQACGDWHPHKGAHYRMTETYRIAGRRRRDIRNLFAAFKAGEDALCPPRRTNRGAWVAGAGILPGDDDSVLEHGAPRIERVASKRDECVLVEIEEISKSPAPTP